MKHIQDVVVKSAEKKFEEEGATDKQKEHAKLKTSGEAYEREADFYARSADEARSEGDMQSYHNYRAASLGMYNAAKEAGDHKAAEVHRKSAVFHERTALQMKKEWEGITRQVHQRAKEQEAGRRRGSKRAPKTPLIIIDR